MTFLQTIPTVEDGVAYMPWFVWENQAYRVETYLPVGEHDPNTSYEIDRCIEIPIGDNAGTEQGIHTFHISYSRSSSLMTLTKLDENMCEYNHEYAPAILTIHNKTQFLQRYIATLGTLTLVDINIEPYSTVDMELDYYGSQPEEDISSISTAIVTPKHQHFTHNMQVDLTDIKYLPIKPIQRRAFY